MPEQLCGIGEDPDGRRMCFVWYFVQPNKTFMLAVYGFGDPICHQTDYRSQHVSVSCVHRQIPSLVGHELRALMD
uniref:Uncharacterized protein n=1 Tax=Peronospora matthiolae TaxID=2874970 RepID=A0AAV1UU43_9STRA